MGDIMSASRNHLLERREAFLVAVIDGWTNPYLLRQGRVKPEEARKYVILSPKFIREVLALKPGNQTEKKIIENLKQKGWIKAKKIGQQKWQLKTRRRTHEDGYLYIQPIIRRLFEQFRITPMETQILAQISSYTAL